jgi:hypothetical protein
VATAVGEAGGERFRIVLLLPPPAAAAAMALMVVVVVMVGPVSDARPVELRCVASLESVDWDWDWDMDAECCRLVRGLKVFHGDSVMVLVAARTTLLAVDVVVERLCSRRRCGLSCMSSTAMRWISARCTRRRSTAKLELVDGPNRETDNRSEKQRAWVRAI